MHNVLIDKDELEQRAARDRKNPYRVREVCWQTSVDCSSGAFHTRRREAVADWLDIEEKRGWSLAHKDMKQRGPYDAQTEQGLIITGQNEWRVRAVFKYTGPTPQYETIELPAALFKHHWLEEDGRLPDLNSDADVAELHKHYFED